MGDNRPDSQDSRFFGVVERELIVGRAWLRYFPLDRMGFVEHPTYDGLSTAAYEPAGSSATIQLSMARP
jgi:signal peptidase I